MSGRRRLDDILHDYGLYLAWGVSLVATGGSLYFSEVRGFVPCELWWWQRILMYPQVLLLGIASYRDDRQIVSYALPVNLHHALDQRVRLHHHPLPGLDRLPPDRLLPLAGGGRRRGP